MALTPKRVLPALVLVLGLGSTVAAQLAPPATLTLRDLVQRPDRWPTSIQLKRDIQFSSGAGAKAGQAVKVLEFNGTQVVVDAGNELVFDVAANDCNLLEAANLFWSSLTPAQRAIDAQTLLQDASLWPERTVCSAGFQLEDGTLLPAGGEYEFLALDERGVKVFSKEHRTTLVTDLGQTDVIARARERALLAPEKRDARIAAALKDLVDSNGKPFASPTFGEARVYVLYYGASWCGPCRKFSPELVAFAKEAAQKYPRLAIVLMSNDEKDADMLEYMQDEKMPWPAMPLASLKTKPLFLSQSVGYIPNLVALDRHGRVLANSLENGRYAGPAKALAELKKALESGLAK